MLILYIAEELKNIFSNERWNQDRNDEKVFGRHE